MIVSLGFGLAFSLALVLDLDLDFELAPKGVAIELVPHFDCDAVTAFRVSFFFLRFFLGMGKQREGKTNMIFNLLRSLSQDLHRPSLPSFR